MENKKTSASDGAPALSAEDIQIAKYIKMSAEVKALTKELDALKDAFKHRGSFAGHGYAVSISQSQSMRMKSKAELEALLGSVPDSYLKPEVRTYVKAFKLDGQS